MADGDAITDAANVPERGTFLFTVSEPSGREEEVILARLDSGDDSEPAPDDHDGSGDSTATSDGPPRIVAWKNFCMHEPDQRLDRGGDVGAALRDGEVVCPRHGSLFDLETGDCDNGPARNQSLVGVRITVEDGTVYLAEDTLTFEHEGGIDDDGDLSTTHMSF